MSRSPFGWSLPPGCTQRQIDEAFGDEGVTKLQDDVFELLERADIAERFIDGIMELIRQGELDRCNRDDAAAIDALADAERDRRMWEDAEAHNRWEDTNK